MIPLLAVAAIELTGLGVMALVVRGPWRYGAVLRAGLGFGVGLVTFAAGLFLASYAGLGIRAAGSAIVVVALALGGRRLVRAEAWRPLDVPPEAPAAGRPLVVAALALMAGVLVSTTMTSLLEPVVEWDVVAIWALKAKVLLAGPVRGAAYFQDLDLAYSHLDYPLLWPFAMAWSWSWTAWPTDIEAPKALGPALLLALAAAFYGLARTRADRGQALLFTTVLLGLPMVTSQTARLLADAPFAYLLLGAAGCVELWLRDGDADMLRLGGLLAAGVLLTKNEGLAAVACLAVATGVTLAVTRSRTQWRSAVLWLVVVPFAIAMPWLLFRTTIPKVHENYGTLLNPVNVVLSLHRLPDVLRNLALYVAAPADWVLLWPALALTFALGIRRRLKGPLLVLPLTAILLLGVYVAVFIVSPWNPRALAETSAARLLLHVAPTLLLGACAVVAGAPGAASSAPAAVGTGTPRKRRRTTR